MRQPVADNWSTEQYTILQQLASNYLTDGMFIQSVRERRERRERRGLIIIIILITTRLH